MNRYKYLIVPFIALILCQIIKFIVESIEAKELKWGRLFKGSGGMPSSHSTFAFTLTFMLLFNIGLDSPLFAVSLIFSFIVAYDAMGVRLESGKQAETINHIVDEIFSSRMIKGFVKLKEELGHKPLEVVTGIILGFVVSYVYTFYII